MNKNHTFKIKTVLMVAYIVVFSLSAFGCVVNEKYSRTINLSKPLGTGNLFVADIHNGSITIW